MKGNCICLLLLLFVAMANAQFSVSDNRHFILKDGKPFFWLGDTAWELFHRVKRIQATRGNYYAFVYTAEGKSFTAALPKLKAAKVHAYWFDPRNAKTTDLGSFDGKTPHRFDPPKSGYGRDWCSCSTMKPGTTRCYRLSSLPTPACDYLPGNRYPCLSSMEGKFASTARLM